MTATSLWHNYFRLHWGGLLPENVRVPIVKLCAFLNSIFQKVINPQTLQSLQKDVVQCLISFELVFTLSFFNIMTHLIVQIVKNILILGTVFLLNMFPFEKFMWVLNKYVCNRARTEGSISKDYGTEEVNELLTLFLTLIRLVLLNHAMRGDCVEKAH